jgi:hypothetical protein
LELTRNAAQKGLHIAPLVSSTRSYLLRRLQFARCTIKNEIKVEQDLITEFASLVRNYNLDLQPISDEERKSMRSEEPFRRVDFWQSPRSRDLLEKARWLTHGNRDLPGDKRFFSLEERSTTEWNERYLDYLKLLEGWKEGEENSSLDYFHMKAMSYSLIARLAPPGPARDSALRSFLAYLSERFAHVENRTEWFLHTWRLLNEARGAKDPADRAYLLDEMSQSGNSIIAVYAALQNTGIGPLERKP